MFLTTREVLPEATLGKKQKSRFPQIFNFFGHPFEKISRVGQFSHIHGAFLVICAALSSIETRLFTVMWSVATGSSIQ
jgi:hypothetical protein